MNEEETEGAARPKVQSKTVLIGFLKILSYTCLTFEEFNSFIRRIQENSFLFFAATYPRPPPSPPRLPRFPPAAVLSSVFPVIVLMLPPTDFPVFDASPV